MADAKSQYNELVSIWDNPDKYSSWLGSQGLSVSPAGMDEYGYVPERYFRLTGYQTQGVTNDEGGISYIQVPQYESVSEPKQGLMQQINSLASQVGERPFVSTSADSKTNKIAAEIADQRAQYGTESRWQGGARAAFGGATGLDVQMAQDLASRGITSLSQIKQKEVPETAPSYDANSGEWVEAPTGRTKTVAWNSAADEPLARQGYQHERAGSGNVWSGTYAGSGNTMYNVDFDPQGNPIFSTSGASSEDAMQYVTPALMFAAIAAGGGAFAPELLGAGEAAGAAGLTGEAGALAANAGLGTGAAGAAGAELGGLAAGYGAEQIGGITAADLAQAGLSAGLDEATMGEILKDIPVDTPMTQAIPPRPEIVTTPISDVGGLESLSDAELTQNLGYDAVESAGTEGVLPTGTETAQAALDQDITPLMDSGAGGGPNVTPGDYFSANTPVTAADAAANAAATAGAVTTTAGLPALKDLIPLAPALTRLLTEDGGGGGISSVGGWSGTVPKYRAVQERIQYDDTNRRPGSAGRRYFTPLRYEPITDTTAPVTTAPVGASNPINDAGGTFVDLPYVHDYSKPTSAAPAYEPSIVTHDRPITNQPGANQPGAQTIPDGVNTGGFAIGGLAGLARGRYLGGPTDGMADKIPANIEGKQPAALSHGEFVIPADVVSHLGNGNSDAGAQRLYSMMDKIRKARTGTTKQGKQINPDKYLPV